MSFFGNLSTLFGPTQQGKRQQTVGGQPAQQGAAKPKFQKHKRNKKQHQQDVRPQQVQVVTPVIPENIQQIRRDAEAKAREIIVEAKSEALQLRSKAEQEQRELGKQLEQQQRILQAKLDRIDERLEVISTKEEQLEKKRFEIVELKQDVEKEKEKVLKELEKVSTFTRDEAKEELLQRLEKKLSKETALFIRQKEEEAHTEADEKVKEILIDAMKHGATEYVPEYTISVVTLPSEDAKGKIIGKSGRNINAFERRTGVDVDLDMSPTEVRLSCFDPVRREIARISLERLVKDGRIQPTRIEEVVDKVEKEMAKTTLEAGKKLCHDVGVFNLPIDLMKMLGKFKFRFSYGQNLIAHTLEETKIGIKIAHELGLDVNTVKLGCLLHDIGKVSEETEGSHVELGIKIAKRYNMPQPVIDCIAQHHEDEPFSGPEQMAVYIADAISGARPGARYENYDEYVKRLQQLEEIAMQYKEVKQAYAIQAGREVRVLLEPEQSKDDDVKSLSLKIRDEIKEKVTYPGTVTVTVIRETRGSEIAK
ncbi:MAG: ribonuclease Y [Patescibacteria group bacterium]|nr:MAG: ribonuclease Y [Patescibacteria group bacterium]